MLYSNATFYIAKEVIALYYLSYLLSFLHICSYCTEPFRLIGPQKLHVPIPRTHVIYTSVFSLLGPSVVFFTSVAKSN
jgi:hypothetical protein